MAPRIFIIGLLAIFLAGCGAYSGLSQPVQSAFMRGDYLQALAALDKAKVDKKDKLLYFLDKGALLHYAGEYEKSNEAFSEAEALADQLETKSATKEVGATLTNETLLPYAGEKYERLLINVFKMLNYAALDEWDEALIEVRRLNTMKEKLFQDEMKDVYKNPFSLYVSALLWSLKHHYNDAYIDYKKTYELTLDKELLAPEILSLSRRLGGLNQDQWLKEFEDLEAKALREDRALLVLVLEEGLPPILDSEETTFLDQKISLPILKKRDGKATIAKVFVDDGQEPVLTTKILARVSDMAEANLPHKRKISGMRKVAKGVVKAGAQVATYEAIAKSGGKDDSKEDKTDRKVAGLLGALLVGALFNATEKADVRIWSTLPETWQIGQCELEPGGHEITVRFYNEYGSEVGQSFQKGVDLKKRDNLFLIFHRL